MPLAFIFLAMHASSLLVSRADSLKLTSSSLIAFADASVAAFNSLSSFQIS
jgi:hypothetical protein